MYITIEIMIYGCIYKYKYQLEFRKKNCWNYVKWLMFNMKSAAEFVAHTFSSNASYSGILFYHMCDNTFRSRKTKPISYNNMNPADNFFTTAGGRIHLVLYALKCHRGSCWVTRDTFVQVVSYAVLIYCMYLRKSPAGSRGLGRCCCRIRLR